MKKSYYLKKNRTFTFIRKYAWIITILIAIGGLWQPKLGLLVLFIMSGLIITSFFTGRYWCGNFCPHGSLFDRILLPISQNKAIPKPLKSRPMIIVFFIFFMFNFCKKIINVFGNWGNYDFLDKFGLLFVNTYLMVLIIGSLMAIFITPRTWCQFCPMGTMQKFSYSLGKSTGVAKKTDKKISISDINLCRNCGLCAKVCPFQLEPYKNWNGNNEFDDINCIRCSNCVEYCPVKILSLK
ncbi:MAG: 4Fe-4S binding protein [Tissierellaceae bacterium]|jgi:polyferredoxin